MKNTIKKELKQFEEEYNIKIISARDTGSRAWNLHSPKSDHDVSFIYIQNYSDYITPTGYKQNIDRQTSTEHDIDYNSWNLDRYLTLLKTSNPSAIEYLQSNLKYYEPCNNYMQNLENHAKQNFKPLALMMHHHSLAKNQYERYLKDNKDISVKRHLYAIRSLMYREHVKKHGQLPTINFPEFYRQQKNTLKGFASHQSEIRRMIKHKQKGNGAKPVTNPRIKTQINKQLNQEIKDENKPDYTKQNINTDHLNKETTQLIKELNQKTCTWKNLLKSTWKAYTNN